MKKLFFIFFAAGFLLISGCCCRADKNTAGDNRVIADIDGYKLTAGDLRDDVPMTLNDLVNKKILLQEAQRENFDKDSNFRKEIEKYWEQALLKLLMKKKIDEFSKAISPDISSDTRHKILQAELDRWVADLRKSAKVKIYSDNLKKMEIK